MARRAPWQRTSRSSWWSSAGFVTIATALVAAVAITFVVVSVSSSPPKSDNVVDAFANRTWLRTLGTTPSLSQADNKKQRLIYQLDLIGDRGHDVSVEQDDHNAVLVDHTVGTIERIDLEEYNLVTNEKLGVTGSSLDVLTRGDALFVINRSTGGVQLRDPVTNKLVSSLHVGTRSTPGVIDGEGTLWMADSATGKLYAVVVDRNRNLVVREVIVVATPGDRLQVALSGERPVVLNERTGTLSRVRGALVDPPVALGLQAGEAPVLSPNAGPDVVPVAVARTGRVILVRGATTTSVQVPGSAHELGAPVIYKSDIYVPDHATGRVYVIDRRGTVGPQPIRTSSPPHRSFDVFVNQDTLFINNPNGRDAFIIGDDGVAHQVDKADGDIPNGEPFKDPKAKRSPDTSTTEAPSETRSALTTSKRSKAKVLGKTVVNQPGSPGAPGAPDARPGDRKIVVSWSPAPARGTPVTGYSVWWTDTSGNRGDRVNLTGTEADLVAGVKNGRVYTVTVVAHSAAGDSLPATSGPVKPTAGAIGAPRPVTTVKANSDGTVSVSWTAVLDDEDNPVAGYDVAVSGGKTRHVNAQTFSVRLTTADGLEIGSPSAILVSALTRSGVHGSPSLRAVVTPTKGATVSNVQANRTGDRTVVVAFSLDKGGVSSTTCSLVITNFSGVKAFDGSIACTGATVPDLNYASAYRATVSVWNPNNGLVPSSDSAQFSTPNKTLTADATPAFGVCPPPPATTTADPLLPPVPVVPAPPAPQCGPDSFAFPTPAVALTGGIGVTAGTKLNVDCWRTGAAVTAAATNRTDARWVHVPGLAATPWMSFLYFNPGGDAILDGLPAC